MTQTSFIVNQNPIIIPKPKISISKLNGQSGIFDGGYAGLNNLGQPQTDIVSFSKNNYNAFGTPTQYDLNYLPSTILKASWEGSDVEFLNYNPKYILHCLKKQRNTRTSSNTKTGVQEFKRDYVRITHLDGTLPNNRKFGNYGGNKAGNYNDYDLRTAMTDLFINNADLLRSADVHTALNIQPTDYVKKRGNTYGLPIFPISYTNWHNDNNNIGNYFGNSGYWKNFFRKTGVKHSMNNKRFVFVVLIEIDNPLNKNKRLVSDFSNEVIIYPKLGKFYDSSNGNTVGDYYYRWEIDIRE